MGQDEKMTDNKELRALAEAAGQQDWFVLGQPWASYTDTFTILSGSPDPHAGVPILKTLPDEAANEDDDHDRQEALAEWLERCDPVRVISILDESAAKDARIAELESALIELAVRLARGRDFYERNGATYTSPSGQELEETGAVLAASDERAEFARTTLSKAGGKS